MQTQFSKISNIILKYFLLFSVCFLWLNYIKIPNTIALTVSIAISALLGYIIYLIQKAKTKRQNISKEENAKIEDTSLQLMYGTKKQVLDFFHNTFKSQYSTKMHNDYISLNNYNFFPIYTTETITQSDVLKALKQSDKEIVIACVSADQSAIKCAKLTSKKVNILTQADVYSILKKYNSFPNFSITKTAKKKLKLTDIKNSTFAKANAKGYLISSFIILFSSFFVRFNIYYTCFSTLLLILAGICLFHPAPKQSEFTL